MNRTVELGWINGRIQLVAFDGQFIEGAKADRRHMACRFLIDGDGNYKSFAKEHISHKEIARLLLESKTIARTLNRVAFIVSANHLLNPLSSTEQSEQGKKMDDYLNRVLGR